MIRYSCMYLFLYFEIIIIAIGEKETPPTVCSLLLSWYKRAVKRKLLFMSSTCTVEYTLHYSRINQLYCSVHYCIFTVLVYFVKLYSLTVTSKLRSICQAPCIRTVLYSVVRVPSVIHPISNANGNANANRVGREVHEHPGHAVSGGVVASEHERVRLAHHLLVVHRTPRLVAAPASHRCLITQIRSPHLSLWQQRKTMWIEPFTSLYWVMATRYEDVLSVLKQLVTMLTTHGNIIYPLNYC